VRIEIFSDIVCPWCYIGKRRLDAALDSSAGVGVEVVWRAFQLYPGIPEEGMAFQDFIKARYPDSAGRVPTRNRIVEEASDAGIEMDYGKVSRMPNTFAGHRLLYHARGEGRQHQLAETLFRYFFCEGRDLGSSQQLIDAAEDAGLDRDLAASFLASGEGEDAVNAELERAANIAVTGVPCFVFAGAYALPGAQTAEVLGQVIERAKLKLEEPG